MNNSLFDNITIQKFNGKEGFDKIKFIHNLGKENCENCDHALLNHFQWVCEECNGISCFPMTRTNNSFKYNVFRFKEVICQSCIKNNDELKFSVRNMTRRTSWVCCFYKDKEYKIVLGGLNDKEYENLTYKELCEAVQGHSNLFFKNYMKND